MIGVPSIFKLIRKTTSLVKFLSTFVCRYGENTERWKWKIPLVGCASCKKNLLFIMMNKAKADFCDFYYKSKARAKESIWKWVSV